MDLMVKRANHGMEFKEGVSEEGLTGFWRGCVLKRGCKVVELGQ